MNRAERREFARHHGVPMPPPEPEPQGIQFLPLPCSTTVQGADTPDGPRVVIVVQTPQGVNGYFLTPDHARQLAGHLHQFATAAATGLQIIGDLGEPRAENGAG